MGRHLPSSTGSDYVSILIQPAAPCDEPAPPPPIWDKPDWESLEKPIKDLRIPPPPLSPSPEQLDTWFAHSLSALPVVIHLHTPVSHPSSKSKPWWSPSLTAVRKEYAKACMIAKKHRTEVFVNLARLSRQGYFNEIKKAKNSQWADFLAKMTPHNIWTAKKFVAPLQDPRLP